MMEVKLNRVIQTGPWMLFPLTDLSYLHPIPIYNDTPKNYIYNIVFNFFFNEC